MNLDKLSIVLPMVMAVQAFAAGVLYLCAGRWGSALYWLFVVGITIAVLLIPRYG